MICLRANAPVFRANRFICTELALERDSLQCLPQGGRSIKSYNTFLNQVLDVYLSLLKLCFGV